MAGTGGGWSGACNNNKIKLSKNLLDMKFMKKSKEKVETEEIQVEDKRLLDSEFAESMKKSGSQFIIEPSFVPCEELVFGRVSFKGQNPEIEKIMKELETEKCNLIIEEKEKRGTISEEEMADRYSTLIGTVYKKFTTKRQRQLDPLTPTSHPVLKRTKFVKPNDCE